MSVPALPPVPSLRFGVDWLLIGVWILGAVWLAQRIPRSFAHQFRRESPADRYSRSRDLHARLISSSKTSAVALAGLFGYFVGAMFVLIGSGAILFAIHGYMSSDHGWPTNGPKASEVKTFNDTYNTFVNTAPGGGTTDPIGGQTAPSSSGSALPPVDYGPIATIAILVVTGAGLLVAGLRARSLLPSVLGTSMLLMGLSPTVTNNFKIGEVFKLDKAEVTVKSGDSEHDRAVAVYAPQRVGLISGFALGCDNLTGEGCVRGQELVYVRGANEASDEKGVFAPLCAKEKSFLLVGRTDRVGLRKPLRSRFESNVGLAQRRAESVKEAIEARCGSEKPSLLTQVAGPRHTPALGSMKTVQTKDLEFPADRSVEIYAVQKAGGTGASDGGEVRKMNVVRAALPLLSVILAALVLVYLGTRVPMELRWKDWKWSSGNKTEESRDSAQETKD